MSAISESSLKVYAVNSNIIVTNLLSAISMLITMPVHVRTCYVEDIDLINLSATSM